MRTVYERLKGLVEEAVLLLLLFVPLDAVV